MLEWFLIGGGVLVLAILADRALAKGRRHVPLSKIRPDLIDDSDEPGKEATDTQLMAQTVAHNNRLNAINGGEQIYHLNNFIPRLREKRKEKDGPSK